MAASLRTFSRAWHVSQMTTNGSTEYVVAQAVGEARFGSTELAEVSGWVNGNEALAGRETPSLGSAFRARLIASIIPCRIRPNT
jgi:hypothetical protein